MKRPCYKDLCKYFVRWFSLEWNVKKLEERNDLMDLAHFTDE